MNLKQIAIALGLLAVVAAVFGFWANSTPGVSVTAEGEPKHILNGSKTPEGNYLYKEDADYYRIEIRYPARVPLGDAAAAQKAQTKLESDLQLGVTQFKANGNFDALTAEDIAIQGLGTDRKYALDAEFKDYGSTNFVSYLYTIYEDTLGAHPNGYFHTLVFDKQGNELGIRDLFVEGSDYLDRLSLLSSNAVTEEMKKRIGQDDVSSSIFAEGLAAQDQNFETFIIDGDTLVLNFPPYQVAAYAAGTFEVRIPLNDLKDILKPGVI